MREYTVNALLAATSLALLCFLGYIWVNGSHYIQEPSITVLIIETAAIASVSGFAIYNLTCLVKRFSGSTRLSSCVGGDTSCNNPHIVFYIRGGKDLTLAEVNTAAEIIAKATGRDTSVVFGVDIDPKVGDRVQTTVVATGTRKEADQVPSCLGKLGITGAGQGVSPSGLPERRIIARLK